MDKGRVALVICLIAGLIGCQAERSITVSEYQPSLPAIEHKAPDSRVFELVRWMPVAPLITAPAATQPRKRIAKRPRQMTYEVEQVYVDRGSPVGFRRRDEKLIAVAGATTLMLDEAHYAWKTMPSHPSQQSAKLEQFVETAEGVFLVVLVVGVVFLILHQERHNIFDCGSECMGCQR